MIGLGLTASTPNLAFSGPSGQTYNFELDFQTDPIPPPAFVEWQIICQGTALRSPNTLTTPTTQQTADLLAYNSDTSSGYEQLYLDATITITRLSDSSTYVCNANMYTNVPESNGLIDFFLSPDSAGSVNLDSRVLEATDFTPNLPNINAGDFSVGEFTCQITVNAPSSPVVINGDTYNATDHVGSSVGMSILGQ